MTPTRIRSTIFDLTLRTVFEGASLARNSVRPVALNAYLTLPSIFQTINLAHNKQTPAQDLGLIRGNTQAISCATPHRPTCNVQVKLPNPHNKSSNISSNLEMMLGQVYRLNMFGNGLGGWLTVNGSVG